MIKTKLAHRKIFKCNILIEMYEWLENVKRIQTRWLFQLGKCKNYWQLKRKKKNFFYTLIQYRQKYGEVQPYAVFISQ